MALYVELDATASNGEQYWYDQYTEGEPRIAAVVSSQDSTSTSGSNIVQYSSAVSTVSSIILSGPEILLSPVASLIEANSTLINNSNITSSSAIIPFSNSETIAAGVRYIDPCASLQYATVTVFVNGRKKWEFEEINSETWTESSVNSENWTKSSINSETWNKVIN